MAADTFHDPDPGWDDEEISGGCGIAKSTKVWVVTGILVTAAVVATLSLMAWWLFFLKDPPYPLPDALKILRTGIHVAEEGYRDSPGATFKIEIKKKITQMAAPGMPTQRQAVEQDQAFGHSSIGTGLPTPEIRGKLSEAVALRSELLKKAWKRYAIFNGFTGSELTPSKKQSLEKDRRPM